MLLRSNLWPGVQDEFEGMQQQSEKVAATAGDAAEEEYARRKLKMRQLGTLRLIAELFNRDLLTHSVMRIVMEDMLGRCHVAATGEYDVPLIECLVQACPPPPPSSTSMHRHGRDAGGRVPHKPFWTPHPR